MRSVHLGPLVVLVACSLHVTLYSPCIAGAGAAPDSSTRTSRVREYPDDPQVPHAAVPRKTSPSTAPRLGSFTPVQVNVTSQGSNILGDAANEPSLAVDPTNPNLMAIGWRQFDSVVSNFREAGWAFSKDGGRTWTFPGVLEQGVFRSDPVLSFDAAGNFYYNSLTNNLGNLTCDVFTSTDGGMTWSFPVFAHGGDKAWMTIDRTAGIGQGNIYSAWSTAAGCCGSNTFTRSVNGGQSYSTPTQVPSFPRWGSMDVGPDGALYVAGADPGLSRFVVAKSTTVQNPAFLPGFDFSVIVGMGGAVGFFGDPNPGGLLGQVWVAVDHSNGPTAGNVYLCASVDPPGPDPLDVHFVRSTDGGQNWSAPVRVNDDPLGNAWQWFGTMSVAPNGRIDVIWNDTRNTGAANMSQLHYASSSDGGVNWTSNQQVSAAWDSHVGWPNQNKIGDYYHMRSDLVGAHLAWAATFNGEQDVYYLRIGDYDCNMNGVGDSLDVATGSSTDWNGNGIPDECENISVSDVVSVPAAYRLLQNVPNPFNPGTDILFDVPERGGSVRLRIFDVAGRPVRTLLDGTRDGGRHRVAWNGLADDGRRMPTGVYLYRLEAEGVVETRRMLLLK